MNKDNRHRSIVQSRPQMKPSSRFGFMVNLLLLLVLAGCTTSYYRKSADKETYGAIGQKSPLVPNMDAHFNIEQTNVLTLKALPVSTNVQEFLGPDGWREFGANVLRLDDALSLAVNYSRNYQARKEQLYLSGLSLTLARHQFAPLFSASGSPNYQVTIGDDLVEKHQWTVPADLSASWLIR